MKIANIFSFHKRSHTYRDTINKSCYDLNIITRLCADRVTKILQVTIHIYRVAYYIDHVAYYIDRITIQQKFSYYIDRSPVKLLFNKMNYPPSHATKMFTFGSGFHVSTKPRHRWLRTSARLCVKLSRELKPMGFHCE